MSQPDPSPPAVHIAVSYDTDVEGAANALIVILAAPATVLDLETEHREAGEESGEVAE